jgi:hypothetical protein
MILSSRVQAESQARPTRFREVARIRRDIGAALSDEQERPPQSLLTLLKDLGTRVRDRERERLFAEVDTRIAEMVRAAGRPTTHARSSPAACPSSLVNGGAADPGQR